MLIYVDTSSGRALAIGALFLFGAVVIGGGVGYLIGKPRGRAGLGFVLGLLLSWIGWIIVAVMSRTPEAEARHNLEVEEATRRLQGG